MLVLGIETSCDETGVALYDGRLGLVANRLHSQAALHAEHGGVVPEIAARDHIRRVLPLVRDALGEAGRTASEVAGVAYTGGPGLIGALLVGAAVGRSLAWGWEVPAVAVHHLEAHLLAPLLEEPAPAFPFLALLVSGGHTQLVAVRGPGEYRTVGESLDDAAGEAFDKTAKLLGLGYPGGPALAALARDGDPGRFRFPRPMTDRPGARLQLQRTQDPRAADVPHRAARSDPRRRRRPARSRRRWSIPCTSSAGARSGIPVSTASWWRAGSEPTGAFASGSSGSWTPGSSIRGPSSAPTTERWSPSRGSSGSGPASAGRPPSAPARAGPSTRSTP